MNKFLLFLLFFCQLIVCHSQTWQELRLTAAQPSSVEDYQAAVQVLKDRMYAADIDYRSVEHVETEEQMVVVLDAAVQLSTVEALIRDVSIGFWPVYWTSDAEGAALQTIIVNAQEDADLSKIQYLSPDNSWYQPAVFAILPNEEMMELAITQFKQVLPAHIRPMWSKPANIEGPDHGLYFGLYLLKTDSLGQPTINEEHISRAEMFINEQMNEPMLNLEFDEEGTALWSKMTEEAAYADNKTIAITFEDRVAFSPRVREPIYSGKSVLTGDFTATELDGIALILNSSKLPMPLTVISTTPLKD
ncbi:MAG: hypothetical protein AAFR36_00300 [Bacteroidota bacterium]